MLADMPRHAHHPPRVRRIAAVMTALAAVPVAAANPPDFHRDIRPILSKNCFACHGPDAGQRKAALRLDHLEGATAALPGGAHAVVPGDRAASALYARVAARDPGEVMPPPETGNRLTEAEIALLGRWIEAGAPWPAHWAFAPLAPGAPPVLPGVAHPVDAFVCAALAERGLVPSPEADRRTLARRLYLDLHGLPPDPEVLRRFAQDTAPDAYGRLVDDLLASPRYGERWARHWLDVAHYGDTHGYDKDKRRPKAWPYRDYVIAALNEDKPYGRFVEEQIAGDVLYPDAPEALVATGFLAAGPWDFVGHVELREGTRDKRITRVLDRDDMVGNTMGAFVSLTVQCARCHDHKFDPISTAEYYGLQAVFAGVERAERPYDPDPEQHALRRARHEEWRAARAALAAAEGDPARADEAVRLAARVAELEQALAALPAPQMVYAAAPDFKAEGAFTPPGGPREVHVLHRGDVDQPGDRARPGALALGTGRDAAFALGDAADDEGARRAALARWIIAPENPLTWRSIVNRVWHYHFGRGLAETPNDFGAMGAPPTHPELLDWLAAAFLEHGQSLKWLHKLLVTSATYRQASGDHAGNAARDAANHYLWRMHRGTLDAESLRDGVLHLAGLLDLRMGGPGFDTFSFQDDHSPRYDYQAFPPDQADARRRSVYRFIVRSVPDPFMQTLDCADPSISVPVRNETLTALQALATLNNPFMVRHAAAFADRVAGLAPDLAGQVRLAHEMATGRPPDDRDAAVLLDYAQAHGLANACRVILNSNAFLFVD
jgi:mono/diheme cytochrome c family protein